MSGISRIMIEQQFATLGIQTVNARLSISTPRPQMVIENIPAEMTVDRKNPSFEVDWKTVHSQSGMRPPIDLSKNLRDKAYNKTMKAIGDTVQDYNFLGKVEQPGNRVAELAKSKTRIRTQTEINLGLMPQQSPKVKWDPGYIDVSWSRHKLIVEWDTEFMPEFTVDPPYSVEIFLRDRPYIKIYIAEGEDPYMAGKVVDMNL